MPGGTQGMSHACSSCSWKEDQGKCCRRTSYGGNALVFFMQSIRIATP